MGPPHWRGGYTQLGEWIATPSSRQKTPTENADRLDATARSERNATENFWCLLQETFGVNFACSFGEYVSPAPKAQLTAAIAASEIFNARDVLTVYPLVPVRVRDDLDAGMYFLIAPASLVEKLPSNIPSEATDVATFPPVKQRRVVKQSPTSWLGVRAPTLHAARKVKAAVLGALALVPHRYERQTRTRYLSLNCMAMCSSAGFHSSCWLWTNDWASVGVLGCT
jgi:hypothetical protein